MKEENPDSLNKVLAVAGDIEMPGLGISSERREEIYRNVSVIIHSAATIKFNEPLKVAMNINYNGTKRILELAHQAQSMAVSFYDITHSACHLHGMSVFSVRN